MSAVPQSGEPRTIVVPGDGTGALTFTIPPGITLAVESVLAQVDATGAGGPVTATLSVLEQSGVVIANKRQGETVTKGVQGSATWALRLDEARAAAAAATHRYAWGVGGTSVLGHNTLYPFAAVASQGITYVANKWRIDTAGKYQVTVTVSVQKAGPVAAGTGFGVFALKNASVNIYTLSSQLPVAIPGGQTWEYHATIVAYANLAVNDTVFMASISGSGNVTLIGGYFGLVQVD